MTISEATVQGISRLMRPEWSWTSWIELFLIEENGKRYHGPWVKVVSIPFVETILVSALDDEDYQPWQLPPGQDVSHLEEKWWRPLW